MKLKKKKLVKKIVENIMGQEVQSINRFRVGWYNHNYLAKIDNKKYFVKIPINSSPNISNESKIYKAMFKNVKTDDAYGIIVREWIEGDHVHNWDTKKLRLLEKEISKFRKLKIKGLSIFYWKKYDQFKSKLQISELEFFEQYTKLYKKDKFVVSHNDLGAHNVIWDGQKIHLIDFEWSSLNSEYFDAAAFYISDNVKLKVPNKEKLNNYIYIVLCYFKMWSYSMPQTRQIKKWRSHYKKLLKNKPWIE